jgi:hypothetical protein
LITGTATLWPNYVVPYELDPTITPAEKVIIDAVSLPPKKLTVSSFLFSA